MEAKEIVTAYFKAVTEGKFEDIPKYKSPNATYWISGENSWPFGGWRTPEQMGETFQTIQERFPNGLNITIHFIIVDGNQVAVHLNNRAERIDGKIYDNEIVTLMKIENGLIAEEREFLDTIHVNDLFCGEMNQ